MYTNLVINNLSIFRNEKTLIESFSHKFKLGQIYAIMGDNGTGKTTLLKTLAGLLPIDSGQILIDDQDISLLPQNLKAIIISFLLQHSPTQPYCLVKDRIAHGFMPSLGYDFFMDKNISHLIEKEAQRLNIFHLLHRRLSKLSGGEQRLVNIAKCLISPKTKILLLDEPSVFLDFTQQQCLINNLKKQAACRRLVIFSSHDRNFIKNCATQLIWIRNKKFSHYPISIFH
jgi:iron complex transport system ATP-binding protein